MKGPEWSVYLQATHRQPPDSEELTRYAEDLAEALEDFSGVVSFDAMGFGVRLSVRAPRPTAALVDAENIISHFLKKVDFPEPLQVVAAEVQSVAELERQLRMRNFPPLVGISEIAKIVSVTRQRALEVSRRPDFPRPLAVLAAGPVWNRHAVARFLERWPRRRTGRPRQTVEIRSAAKLASKAPR